MKYCRYLTNKIKPTRTVFLADLTNQQKFNYIVSLVQLMKIDERMYKEEIQYCSHIAKTLGYDQQVMFELMLHVKSVPMSDEELTSLFQLTEKYLQKKLIPYNPEIPT